MNILSPVEMETIKTNAMTRMNTILRQEELNSLEEMQLIESAQTLFFLSLLANNNADEIAKNRDMSAGLIQKFGRSNSSSA